MASPSILLQKDGLLAGTTIHVEGDAGGFHISAHFDIHPQPESTNNLCLSMASNSSSSMSRGNTTPPITANEPPQISRLSDSYIEFNNDEKSGDGKSIMTRLRSGVITPVSYFQSSLKSGFASLPRRRQRRSREAENVLERLLRRRSLPVRPCNAYSFFVMANWNVARSSSFEETSKRLREMWFRISQEDKQTYVEMALKDKARYQTQCARWRKIKGKDHLRL